MPRATVNMTSTTRHDLKTLPGGFVELRRLSYGQTLQRQSLLTLRMIRDAETKASDTVKSEINMANLEVTTFDFTNCIVDHNLEDENGRKLVLSNPAHFQRLDPRIGQEIDQLISEMNNFDEESEEELGNSLPESEPPF